MRKIEGLLFDCDGVIMDTETLVRTKTAHLLNDLGYDITPKEAEDRWKGYNFQLITKELELEGVDFVDTLKDPKTYEYLATKPEEYALTNNIVELLEATTELPKGVCSNGRTARIRESFKLAGIDHHFDFMNGRDVFQVMKPDPQVFILGSEELGVDIKNCLVIEDSATGLEAGVKSGAITVAYLGTRADKNELAKLNPDYFANDLLEILDIIKKHS